MKIISGDGRILDLINIIKKVENNAEKDVKVTNVPNFNIPAYEKF